MLPGLVTQDDHIVTSFADGSLIITDTKPEANGETKRVHLSSETVEVLKEYFCHPIIAQMTGIA